MNHTYNPSQSAPEEGDALTLTERMRSHYAAANAAHDVRGVPPAPPAAPAPSAPVLNGERMAQLTPAPAPTPPAPAAPAEKKTLYQLMQEEYGTAPAPRQDGTTTFRTDVR
jgi:hypothetical protein